MDWTELVAWIGWAATLGTALYRGWRPWTVTPLGTARAQLFNAQGRLDSVRTFTGKAPASFTCRAGVYVLDKTAQGAHFTYRLTQ